MSGFTENGPLEKDGDWDLTLGSVRGYRWWNWSIPAYLAGHTLASPCYDFGPLIGANNYTWADGKVEAKCDRYAPTWDDLLQGHRAEHEVPEYRITCGCGFWGYWPPGVHCSVIGGVSTLRGHSSATYLRIPVFGSIRASGRVIIGELGFRSQYAQIEALCIPKESAQALTKWHGVREVMDTSFSYVNMASWVSSPPVYSQARYQQAEITASEKEVLARLAVLETALGDLYPSARIVSSQDALVRIFPPEKDYYKPGEIFY